MIATTNNPALTRRIFTSLPTDLWTAGTLTIAALVAAPIISVLLLALSPSNDIWYHLVSTVLPRYIRTTLLLMIGVGIGTATIGTGTAWLVTLCNFPGRRAFEWALLLPLAIPAYVVAYVYTDILEFAGPVQTTLRDFFGWKSGRDYWFPEIRSLGGAIIMMTLSLYPYVYLLARIAFLQQSISVLEACRTLGRGPWRAFFQIALPLARPAVVVGVSLVLMEALNDFGIVDFFSIETLTAGIYDVWLNMNNAPGAAQLATASLAFVLSLVGIERYSRRKQQNYQTASKYNPISSYSLTRGKSFLAFLSCLLPIALGFLIPAGVLLVYATQFYEESLSANFLLYARNSLVLSSLSATIATILGLFLAYGVRLSGNWVVLAATRFASIGYAIPGAVLAVGVIIPLSRADSTLNNISESVFGIPTGFLFS
ncbi:MAG: iron ABC transporter permease, partial [Nitrospinaceae bacterium]|nr:iron ABC transporter permease [Nitrospinaceae bacterium]